jgi:AGZA family xanthine/uracil permease-like MFS transporter
MKDSPGRYRWFVLGDWNGFFGLMFDNLTVLSFLAGILIFGFGYPADIVYTRMFPGTAFGVLFGDLVYTWLAFRLAKRTGKQDVTAMPLGLDTPSTIGIALVVLGPAFIGLKNEGMNERDAAMMTWYIGMATMVFIGIVKVVFSFLGQWVQKIVPQAGLLGSLAGIGLALIGLIPLVDIFGMPLVGVVALGIIFYSPDLHFGLPLPTLGFIEGMSRALNYLPLAIPFGILTVVGGINVTESARVAGDDYNTREILLTEAVATLVAGVCGGVAQSTPYIGQPAYKRMGSRAGYTLLTGLFIGLGGVLGYVSFAVELIPRAVLAPILVFVALDIVVQAFLATPARHAPAVAFALFPTVARLLSIKLGNPEIVPSEIFTKLMNVDGKALPELLITIALGNGFIVTAMLWGGFLAELIDRRFGATAVFLLILAGFSFFGVVHSALPDGSMYLPWTLEGLARQVPYQFAFAYLALAVLLLALSRSKEARLPAGHSGVS